MQSAMHGDKDLQWLLKDELFKRTQRNSRYSLRSFAKHLGLSPTYLSLIINGKRQLAPKSVSRITQKLGINHTPQSPVLYAELPARQFELISTWYHFAILELLNVSGFQLNTKTVSSGLGISIIQSKMALDLLESLALIRKNKFHKWELCAPHNTSIDNEKAAMARLLLQKQLLELSLRSLDEFPISQRDHSSITFAMDVSQVKVAKEKIKSFRRDLCKLMETTGEKNSVYTLSVSLFPHFIKPSKKKGYSNENQ